MNPDHEQEAHINLHLDLKGVPIMYKGESTISIMVDYQAGMYKCWYLNITVTTITICVF